LIVSSGDEVESEKEIFELFFSLSTFVFFSLMIPVFPFFQVFLLSLGKARVV